MIILPAIDIIGGRAVRLYKGDYSRVTDYGRPQDAALDFAAKGAEWIHLVDLEGARSGETPNIETIKSLIECSGLKAEVGGGIRNMRTAEKYLNAGVARVVLGTAAVTDPEFRRQALKEFGEAVAIGVDIKQSYVSIKGWTENSAYTADEFCAMVQDEGASVIVCTDVSRDGAMQGTNLELYRHLADRFSLKIVASGGVSSIEDVRKLREYDIYAAIIGKAYYTGAIDIREALEAAR